MEATRTAVTNGKLWGQRAHDWSTLQERVHEPLYRHALEMAKVAEGTKLLDVGCGSGMALRIAAEIGAVVSGIDAAEALLAIARARVPSADLHCTDLEELPFHDGQFDVTSGFNSFQYAGRPSGAIQEAARVTRKGGLVIIATWAPPELTQAASLLGALKPLLPSPPPGSPGPFALSDETALRALAAEARLTPIGMHDVDSPFTYPDLATGVAALDSSGVAVRAVNHSGAEAVSKAHEAALRAFVRLDGTVVVQNRFRYLIATVA